MTRHLTDRVTAKGWPVGSRLTFKAGPFRVTASKSGLSYSAGAKGFRVTKRAAGRMSARVGAPGTGVSYTVTERRAPRPSAPRQAKAAAPAPRPAPPRPAVKARPAKPPRPPRPLPGTRSTIAPRPPWGLRSPLAFQARDAAVTVSEEGVWIARTRAGRIGNQDARIRWQEIAAVDFLDPRRGRLGHVHFATAGEPRGLTALGRGDSARAAGRNAHAVQFSSRQRGAYEDLRRLLGG